MMFTSQGLRLFYVLVAVMVTLTWSASASPVFRTLQGTAQDDTEESRLKLFEGDILLVEREQYRERRSNKQVTSSNQEASTMRTGDNTEYSHIWQNRIVYYKFGLTLNESYKATFTQAMEGWEEYTCIEFQLAPDNDLDHLVFIKSDDLGCSSYVGRKGGPQLVSMSDYCNSLGHAIHAIGHAIGLWHEHSRPDRDSYIDVLYENIIETEMDNFGKLRREKFELVPDVGYDIESIMHYGPYAFSKEESVPPKETIRLREDAPLNYKHCTNLLGMGQRDELSYLDKLRANKLYSCHAEIIVLEAQGRDCVIPPPTTTPSPVPTQPLTTMPEPTPSQPPITPTVPRRLKSGSVITLRLEDHSKSFEDLDSLKCTPTCRKTNCVNWGSKSSCNRIDHQFEIVTPEDPDAKKIKSGAKVALRSKSNPAQWLDCSNLDGVCSISRCMSNNANSTNASITTCDSHYFTILGVGRRQGRLLNTNHNIQLRHERNESYLSCNTGDMCKLLECVGTCKALSFKFNIL